MFAVIYKFKLKPSQEDSYQLHWNKIAGYFIEHRGAIGSCLHKGEDGLWIAYSRWPDKKTRDASWPGDENPDPNLPDEIYSSIKVMQEFKKENSEFIAHAEEFHLEIVNDLLCHN